MEVTATGKSPRGIQGPGCRPRAANGECTFTGNGGRRRHTARGARSSSGGWQVKGVGYFQVGGALHQ